MATAVLDVEQLALDGLAVVAAITDLFIQTKYIDLADDYFHLYKKQRDFYYDNFQGGGFETQFLNQVFDTPLAPQGMGGVLYQPQYVAQNALVSNFADPLSLDNFFKEWWLNHSNMYGTIELNESNGSPIGWEPDEIDLQGTISDFSNYLARYEEHRKDVYDQRTWEWQNQALNFGVKQASVVQSGLATSFGFLDEASTGLADWFATQSNGLSTYSGYRKAEAGASAALAARAGNAKRMATDLGNNERGGLIPSQSFPLPQYSNKSQPWQTITN